MKQHLSKRILFWVLLVLSVLTSVWWCLYFPYSAKRVYGAIPSNFAYLSRHANLGERWQEFAEHPVFRVVSEAVGVSSADLDEVVGDPDIDKIVRMLAGRETVVAYVPFLGDTGKPAWIVSSWVGGTGRTLEWAFSKGGIEGVERFKRAFGGDIQSLPTEDPTFGAYLSMAVVEGVWLAAVSDVPDAVGFMMDRVLAGRPLADELERCLREDEICPQLKDMGWGCWSAVSRGVSQSQQAAFGLSDLSGGKLRGWVRGDTIRLPRPMLNQVTKLDSVPLGVPELLCMLPAGGVIPWLLHFDLDKRVREILISLSGEIVPESPFIVGLYGGENGGRMLGMQSPALVCAWRMRDPERLPQICSRILDDLNGAYGWTLIPGRGGNGGARFIPIDTSSPGIYASLPDSEKPCVGVVGDWVVLGSNMKMLVAMAQAGPRTEIFEAYHSAADDAAVWGGEPGKAAMFVDMEIGPTAEAVRKAIAIYELMLLGQPSEGSAALRAELGEVRRWLQRLNEFGACSLWMSNRKRDTEVVFSIDAPNGSKKP